MNPFDHRKCAKPEERKRMCKVDCVSDTKYKYDVWKELIRHKG